MANQTTILIGFETGLLKGMTSLRWALDQVQTISEVLAISTVVQSHSSTSSSAALKVVAKLATGLKADEVIKKLIEIEKEFENTIKLIEPLRCYLLAYDQLVSISPAITLPHPAMIAEPGWMYCCFEVWKNYRHPILEQTLDKIIKSQGATNVEFHSQGRALLTFHNI